MSDNNGIPVAYFMMGGPASGKSSYRKKMFPDLRVVDGDDIKASHPDYNPKNPGALHAWSQAEAVRALYATMALGFDFVYDGTGSTAEKYVRFIQSAQQAGYETHVVYVTCALAVALERNQLRERTVDEAIVREKHSTIATSFEIVSRYADRVTVVKN